MKTPLAHTSTFRHFAFAAVLATGCSSSTDSIDSNAATCQACATAGNSGTASGGGTSVATGGANTTSSVGGTRSTGGAPASGGNTMSTATGGTSPTGGATSAVGGKAATGGSLTTGTGGANTAPSRCSIVSGTVAQSLVTAGAILLDVRTASEYATDGLPGAINMALADLPTRMGELDRSKNIVVYCASGNRSSQANTQLCDAGYNVYNLGARANWLL